MKKNQLIKLYKLFHLIKFSQEYIIKKYHPDKINNLGPKRQTEALKKKERLQDAYEFMLKKISDGT